MTANLAGRTLFVTGASRGIGKAIALRAACDGANIVVAAKTDQPHDRLPGTIHTAAAEIEAAGGNTLAIKLDVRDEAAIAAALDTAARHFGGIDALINNAGAISLTGTQDTPMRRFDLMFAINVRATYACTQAAIGHLSRSDNPHVLNISPPLNLKPRWFRDHCAYTISKYGMSMCVIGMAAEFLKRGIAVNALWPRSVIATSALNAVSRLADPRHCRTPAIMADAAHAILSRPAREATGQFFIDEDLLRRDGVTEFDAYAVEPGQPLMMDLFVD